jgi:protein SCO1
MPLKTVRVMLWLAVAAGLFALGVLSVGGFGARDGGLLQASGNDSAPGAPLGGAFSLVDNNGQEVTEAVFRDRPTAVFFGFTHCPDICPTALMEISGWIEALGGEADRMRFVFVTVDPERDTPEVLDEYVSAFSEKIVGVTGQPEAVRDMLRDYGIVFRRVEMEGGDYSMDHTASVFLLDANGSFVGTIDRAEPPEAAMAKLQRLVAG